MSLARLLLRSSGVAAAPAFATIPYTDDFAIDTSDDWAYGGEAVNGTITVAGGSLIYTRGAGDGARPRIVRGILVTPGANYTVTIPAPTGTAARKELWVSSDGGSFAAAITPVAINEALIATFTAPLDGFGVVWIVMRAGTDSVTGETVAISSASMDVAAELEVAVLAAVGTASTTAATIDTASATFAVGDRLIACLSHRRNATIRTHDSITSSGWTATWTKRPDQLQEDTGLVTSHRLSMWDGVVTTAGTGPATGTLSGDAFSRALLILRVPGMAAVDQQAAASNEAGTTVSAAWAATPAAGALGVAFMTSEGTGATLAVTGLTAIADTALAPATGHQVRLFQKLASLPDPLAGTGATNNTAKILGGLSVVGA